MNRLHNIVWVVLLSFSFTVFAQNHDNVNWTIVGDETFPEFDAKWSRSGSSCGIGQVRSIAIDPSDANHLIIGTVGGGVWETHNALAKDETQVFWACLTNDIPAYTISRVMIKNNTIYAACSSKISTKYSSSIFDKYGMGVIKKDMNATTWEVPDLNFSCTYFDVVSHNGSTLIYALGKQELYKSYDDGNTWQELDVKSIIKDHKTTLTRLIIKPDDPNTVFLMAIGSEGVLYQTKDGGETWQDRSDLFSNLLTFDFSKKRSSVEAYYEKGADVLHLSLHTQARVFIIKSKDWKHFELYNSKTNKGLLTSAMINTAFVKINESDYLYGATRLHKLIEGRSSVSLSRSKIHDDIRALELYKRKDNDETITFIGHDGGIALSYDFGQHFVNISGNLNLFQSYNMAYNNHNGHRIITIGVQDGTWYRLDRDGNNKWDYIELCCEGGVYTQPDNPDVTYFVVNSKLKRIDTGVIPIAPKHAIKPKYIEKVEDVDAPIAFHPDHPETILYSHYLGIGKKNPYGNTLELSFDKGETSSKLTIEKGTPYMKGRPTDMAFCKSESNVFYFSSFFFKQQKDGSYTGDNHLYKSINMNDAPEQIVFEDIIDGLRSYDAEVLDKTPINDLEVSAVDPDKIWLSFGNIVAGKKIYFSNDGGDSWQNISYNLPKVPVNKIQYDTQNKQLYIGTDLGVYILNDRKWEIYGAGLPIAIISDLVLDPISNEVVACTFGRSVWVAPLKQLCEDVVVTERTTWREDKNICGDLIVKNGAKLTIKNAVVTAENVIIAEGAIIRVKKSGALNIKQLDKADE